MQVQWNYQSQDNAMQSLSWSYKLDGGSYSSPVTGTHSVSGSTWLSGVSHGSHTLYVALLDSTNGSILATDSHVFSLTSSTEPEDPGTSNDDITIINPGSGSVIERNATLSVDLSYASDVSSSGPPRWAYKLNEDFYSTQTSAIEVNSTSVDGWLDGLEDGEYTLYVALLEAYSGDFILAEDNVTFELVGEDEGVPPYFNFTDTDLSQITGRTDLSEGNYTILIDYNSSDSSYFNIAPVYLDENGFILVEIDSSVSSSIDFGSLESYLDGNNMEPLGFVDFMPFNFRPIARIDLNSTSELVSQINGYSSLYYQEYTPHEWHIFDEFNESVLNTDTWDFAYFAGGVAPTVSGGKVMLSGNASTVNDSFYVPEILGIGEVPTDEGNSALFLNKEGILGVELEVTIPSQGNSQEFGFFIDAFDNQEDHLEIIELAWRKNGINWSWEEPSDHFGQTTYQSLDAELNKTYKVSVTHINQNTRVWIDGELVSNIKDNNFTARSWLIGAFNDNGESFVASIDNVRVLKALPADVSPDHYWALSIENSDSNKSDLVVDMAGFVYEGHFGDYWYHWFSLSTYEPNSDEEIQNRDWSEHHFGLSSGTVGDVYSTFPQIGQDHSLFTKNEFNMTENNELNITIGNVQFRLPELFGDLSYSVQEVGETNQQLPISATNDGNIIVNQSIDYESQSQLSFYLTIGDDFDRNITELVTILIEDVFEDFDGDGQEDHLDSDIDGDGYENEYEISNGFDPRNADSRPQLALVYTLSPHRNSSGAHLLKGNLLTDGGVSLTEIGFEINGDGYSLNEKIPVNTNVSEGGDFTLVLSNLTPGETYTYRAYASNVVGYNTGAPRKFTVEKSQDWWYGAEELEAGWKSNWIGVFLPQPNGWAYHTELGWAFVSPDGSGGLWLWDEGNGWHWTREGIWPFLWSNNRADWLYFMKSGNRVFLYDYSTQSFISDF
jgi:hypothetical protein